MTFPTWTSGAPIYLIGRQWPGAAARYLVPIGAWPPPHVQPAPMHETGEREAAHQAYDRNVAWRLADWFGGQPIPANAAARELERQLERELDGECEEAAVRPPAPEASTTPAATEDAPPATIAVNVVREVVHSTEVEAAPAADVAAPVATATTTATATDAAPRKAS